MDECFADGGLLMNDLRQAAMGRYPAAEMKDVLSSYGSILGIDRFRNYYVLDDSGEMLAGSDTDLGAELIITPNILSAMRGSDGNISVGGTDYSDWAKKITVANGDECIIYIKDSLEEMRQLNSMLFSIILQAMLVGIVIAIVLSFFLAKSISSPIQSLAYGTQLVASGEFSHKIEVNSADEIGVLSDNFNYMKERLRLTLEEVDGEREKLDVVLSSMKDAVLAFTADGEVLHSNDSASEMFGDEMMGGGLTLERVFDILDIPLVIVGNNVKLTSSDAEAEMTKDGFIFHDRIYDSKVYDVTFAVMRYVTDKKHATGCVIIIHDVTGRYELDESRREFVANVSHELRTPLTSIKGATETVRMDPEMDAEMRDYFLDMVLSESDRMTRIVSDLLVLSRLDNKRTQWAIETFDLKQSIRHLCEVMRSDLEAHNHKITFGCDKDLPEITADRQRIEQVIINIISNSIKYTPDGGHIDIRLYAISGKRFVRVQISDNGMGIPEEDIAHLFERFYRVEKSRTTGAGGTGLGLAIAKELVEAHGGKIAIDSKLDEGTCVTIDLPVECKLKNE